MLFNDYYEFDIAVHFMSALINDDYSGLTDIEERQLKRWLSDLSVTGHFDPLNMWPDFDKCEICGDYAECVTVRLYFHNAEVTV